MLYTKPITDLFYEKIHISLTRVSVKLRSLSRQIHRSSGKISGCVRSLARNLKVQSSSGNISIINMARKWMKSGLRYNSLFIIYLLFKLIIKIEVCLCIFFQENISTKIVGFERIYCSHRLLKSWNFKNFF